MRGVDCIRKGCIEDPMDLYHVESHACFVCGVEFDPTTDLLGEMCPKCGWYKCPKCGGCQCSLTQRDWAWVEKTRSSYCVNLKLMAALDMNNFPETDNPHVRNGLGIQLRFCRRWAVGKLSGKT